MIEEKVPEKSRIVKSQRISITTISLLAFNYEDNWGSVRKNFPPKLCCNFCNFSLPPSCPVTSHTAEVGGAARPFDTQLGISRSLSTAAGEGERAGAGARAEG